MTGGNAAAAWGILVVAGLLEIVWATALKYSYGFTRLWPGVIAVSAALASFVLLALALKSLPVGTAYAVWVGIGALGVAIAGAVLLGESLSLFQLVCLVLIVIGVIGLRVAEG